MERLDWRAYLLPARVVLLILMALLLASPGVGAQTTPAATPSAAVVDASPTTGLESPRAALRTFLSNMRRAKDDGDTARWREAARALDLRLFPEISREQDGYRAAYDLHEIINRIVFVEYDRYPDETFLPDRFTFHEEPEFSLMLERDPDDGAWRFNQETIRDLPRALVFVRSRDVVEGTSRTTLVDSPATWFRVNLPPWFFERHLVLENLQWMALLLVILCGVVLDRALRAMARRAGSRYLHAIGVRDDGEALAQLGKWLGLSVAGVLWLVGLEAVGISGLLNGILHVAALLFTVTCVILALLALIDVGAQVAAAKATATPSRFDDILVPLVSKALKIFVVAMGIVVGGNNLPGVDLTGLLAGLGIGGLAFALAAKDTVENLFGSVAILIDRPFEIGDWVVIGDVEGTVEVVGMRSTRIRTFYNSLITVPNSNLIRAKVDNMGARQFRRISTKLGVTYNTPPEKIDAFCEGIRELVRTHPYTRKDNYHVWLNEFGPHSLNILVYVFHRVPDWSTELRERHRFFLDIMRLAKRLGVEFAFPTQTLYLERGSGPANPDEAAFTTGNDGQREREHARQVVHDLVRSQLHDGAEPFPPPPVTYPVVDPRDLALSPRNRGGDSEAAD